MKDQKHFLILNMEKKLFSPTYSGVVICKKVVEEQKQNKYAGSIMFLPAIGQTV